MKEYLSPLSDIFIKYLFASEDESSHRILKSFINAVLTDKGFDPVKSVLPKNPFQHKQFIEDKYAILDILAEDMNGKQFNIEVQTHYEKTYPIRSLYYWSRIYASQINEGDSYSKLRPVVCINLLDFTLFPDLPELHQCFIIVNDQKRDYVLTDHFFLHYIQIPSKFSKTPASQLERWLLYFKEEGREDEAMKILIKDDDILREAHKKYERFTKDKELFYAALSREKFVRDQITREESARNEGIEQGIETGIEKGRKEGISIGEAKGMIKEKQIILTKLLTRKFQHRENLLSQIYSCNDPNKLDKALEEILTAETVEEVLELIK